MVEFDVASPDKVIQESLDQPSANSSGSGLSITISVEPNLGMYDSVKDELHDTPSSEAPIEKAASYSNALFGVEDTPPPTLNTHQYHKAKDSLLTKVADCNYRAIDLADEIANSFKGLYTRDKYAGFELDALSMYGNAATPALQMVRRRLGQEKLARNLNPQESYILSDRHLVLNGETTELQKVAQLVSIATECNLYSSGLRYLDKARGK